MDEPDRFSRFSIAVGLAGGLLFAFANRFTDLTPCCGDLRAIVDLGRIPLGLFLLGFALVQIIRAVIYAFRRRWRAATSMVCSVAATPLIFVLVAVPLIFDPDYWRTRAHQAELESEIAAKGASDDPPLAQLMGRDVSTGFAGIDPNVFKLIVYDASDEIARPAAQRSDAWNARARLRLSAGCSDLNGLGRRIVGHFYIYYAQC